jgi:hypothetical protein
MVKEKTAVTKKKTVNPSVRDKPEQGLKPTLEQTDPNDASSVKMDLYEWVYWTHCSKRHIYLTILGYFGKEAKKEAKLSTLKRCVKQSLKEKFYLCELGLISEDAWERIQIVFKCIKECKDEFKNVFLDIFKNFQEIPVQEQNQANIFYTSQELSPKVWQILEVFKALYDKDQERYDENVKSLQLPIPFLKDEIWEEYHQKGNTEKLNRFFKEVLLLGALYSDMAFFIHYAADTRPFTRGDSSLLGYFMVDFKKSPKKIRARYLDFLLKQIREKRPDLDLKTADKVFVEQTSVKISSAKPLAYWTIQKYWTIRMKKGKSRSSSMFDSFIKRIYLLSLKEDASDLYLDDLTYHRTGFVFFYMVETICEKFLDSKMFTFDALCANLLKYREWLCKEIFKCPLPAKAE